jgi:hypothetical protein
MNEINQVLDRCIAKSDERKSQPQTLSEIEKPSTEVTEREALAMRRLACGLLRLEMAVLLLEVRFLLFSIRERSRAEQPTRKIETAADLEAALRGSPKARVSP